MGNDSYGLLHDILMFKNVMEKYPTTISFERMFKEEMGVETLPPVTGRCMLGRIELFFNNVDSLADIYVNKNQ